MSEWKKALYILIVFFVFLGGCYLFYYYTFNKNITEINESIEKEKEFIDLKKEQINKELEQEKDPNETNYFVYIPKDSGIPNILDFFSRTAEKNNVNIEHIEINNQDEDSSGVTSISELGSSQIKMLSIKMFLNGNYVDIRSFLNDIYNGDRLLNLTTWQWESTDDSDVNIYLTYDAYYYPNNYDLFLDLPAIPTYNPANRVNPIQ